MEINLYDLLEYCKNEMDKDVVLDGLIKYLPTSVIVDFMESFIKNNYLDCDSYGNIFKIKLIDNSGIILREIN